MIPAMSPARRFLFRLALESGYWVFNPEALSRRMPYRILREWYDYATLEPFGEERADLRAGIVASTIANVFRGKRQRPFKPAYFMPKFGGAATPERRQPSPRQLSAKVFWINKLLGGTFQDLREKRE